MECLAAGFDVDPSGELCFENFLPCKLICAHVPALPLTSVIPRVTFGFMCFTAVYMQPKILVTLYP